MMQGEAAPDRSAGLLDHIGAQQAVVAHARELGGERRDEQLGADGRQAGLAADLVIFDGSGAAIPPVEVDRRILVARTDRDATAYLNPYRVLVSDLVVLVGDGDPEPIRAVKDIPVVRVELRLAPVEPLAGRRTAVFTTGPAPTEHLDGEIVAVSRNLAHRGRLREDLAAVEADVYLVEIKAAAIDVVAEAARERGVALVFAANEVVSRPGEPDLDVEVAKLVRPAVRA
jgi:cyclic 2,3-diphosphoglycerate synthetase